MVYNPKKGNAWNTHSEADNGCACVDLPGTSLDDLDMLGSDLPTARTYAMDGLGNW